MATVQARVNDYNEAGPMRKTSLVLLALVIVPVCLIGQGHQNSAVISVDLAHPGAALSPQMFGIFFEDINFGADGGLYPERIKNRSFEFDKPLMGWHQILTMMAKGTAGENSDKGEMDVLTENPLHATNPHYLRVRVYEPGYGFYNTGFRGIGVAKDAEYRFSVYARSSGPKSIRATLTDPNGHNREWKARGVRRPLEEVRNRYSRQRH
jgi:alpha-N-arabinofuranosidase